MGSAAIGGGNLRGPSGLAVGGSGAEAGDGGNVGRIQELGQIPHHFAGGGDDTRLKQTVSDGEVADLVAFLQSLTDEGFVTNPKFSLPPAACPLPADAAMTAAESNAAKLHNSPPGP